MERNKQRDVMYIRYVTQSEADGGEHNGSR